MEMNNKNEYFSSSCFMVKFGSRKINFSNLESLSAKLFIILLFTFSCCNCNASDVFVPEPLEVFEGDDAAYWKRVEHLKDNHNGFVQENFHPEGKQNNPLIKKWFGGNSTPHSGEFILHCANNFDNPKCFSIPVLFIPGSCDNANRGWVHPYNHHWEGKLSDLPHEKRGFAVWMSELGYSVFSVTFAQPQGCNIMQSEIIADAITRIRILLNRQNDPNFKVNLIAHSKGNVAARLYLSDSRKLFPAKTFLTNFRKDVDTYVAIAAPFRGLDTPFRYYGYNLSLAGELVKSKSSLNAPLAAEKVTLYGKMRDFTELSINPDVGKNYFPGQCQMLFDLTEDGVLPLGIDSATGDANFSRDALYYGGSTAWLKSRGIKVAIELGEKLIYRLEEQGIDRSVKLGIIAGKSPHITFFDGKVVPMLWEYMTPKGDGLVPLVSSTYSKNILRRGSNLIGLEILDLNHVNVARDKSAFNIIDNWFMKYSHISENLFIEARQELEQQ
ncbi:MAG: hypothetical protein HQM10_18210 [Candidatus Riflebacteria bacterium]|nr:hypothetical protein [Candidatus Riflebacteria bacterium]